jgi:pyridoxal phosphate enzyme (YggS family)
MFRSNGGGDKPAAATSWISGEGKGTGLESSLERLAGIRSRISEAERVAGRPAGSVKLVVVTKTFGADAVEPLLAAGERVFGENRVAEAKDKWPALKERYPGVELHLIGPLQTNKVRDAIALFDVIHSLDRPSLAGELQKAAARGGAKLPRLRIQVNTGEEAQKGGLAPGEVDAFLEECRARYGLTVEGLMCIPPVDEAPAPHFALLAKIAARNGLTQLSMGMSADFETAIAFGATEVRIGSAILGERP